jgi:hypothetical protein
MNAVFVCLFVCSLCSTRTRRLAERSFRRAFCAAATLAQFSIVLGIILPACFSARMPGGPALNAKV